MRITIIQQFSEAPYGLVPVGAELNLSDNLAAAKILAGLAVPSSEQHRPAAQEPELPAEEGPAVVR